ncbi:50S ribosomal protein L3 [Ureaplasma sp. ES3154-GEN]|uniref:50S ribosomal protein L3 n=1 Tax=Ureaplasma sp. ES3154-GEN TaxID=2984844 RepID=UPI0021E8485F|nr:50S ribosomal protein L3 [Ureaplasma sp. ES3154-GEN]MCV3743605.1 50S ribosomal protein L3 [Ureaplasma sp. ES3154-GEN]
MKSLLGTKVGMTQVFSQDGKAIAATVVYVEPNQVLAVRSKEKDGYDAVQVGYQTVKEKALNKPELGLFNKLNVEPKRYVKELRNVSANVGDKLGVDTFVSNELVNVQAITKGHGFTGSIKRHNYSMGPVGHGAGYPHRYVGSIACGRGGSQAQRVFKGTKLPGHYGHELVTIKNLLVLDVRADENLILIKGAIPGPKGSLITIKSAQKENKASPVTIVNYNLVNQEQAEK